MTAAAATLVPKTRFVEGPGGAIAVSEYGDPSGIPLLSLHGTPGSRLQRYWSQDVDARFGFRTIMFDRPGYGRSARQSGRSIADGARDVEAVANGLGLDRFALLGLSGGGPYALAASALLSDRVLACGSVAAFAPPREVDFDWFEGMSDETRSRFQKAEEGEEVLVPFCELRVREMIVELEARNRSLMDRSRRLSDEQRAFAESRRLTALESFATGVGGIVDDQLALLKPWGVSLASIECVVKVWVASMDRSAPPSHGRWVAEHTPGATLAVLEGDHMSALAVHYETYLSGLRGVL